MHCGYLFDDLQHFRDMKHHRPEQGVSLRPVLLSRTTSYEASGMNPPTETLSDPKKERHSAALVVLVEWKWEQKWAERIAIGYVESSAWDAAQPGRKPTLLG